MKRNDIEIIAATPWELGKLDFLVYDSGWGSVAGAIAANKAMRRIPRIVINAGFAGGTNDLEVGDVYYVNKVNRYMIDTENCPIKVDENLKKSYRVTHRKDRPSIECYSGDAFITHKNIGKYAIPINSNFIVDMELGGIAFAHQLEERKWINPRIKLIAIKIVSDKIYASNNTFANQPDLVRKLTKEVSELLELLLQEDTTDTEANLVIGSEG